MSEKPYYYAQDGKQHGPVSLDEIRARASAGELKADDLVWNEGMASWTRIAAVPGLVPSPAPPARSRRVSWKLVAVLAVVALVVLGGLFWWRLAAPSIDGLVRIVPRDANALLVVRGLPQLALELLGGGEAALLTALNDFAGLTAPDGPTDQDSVLATGIDFTAPMGVSVQPGHQESLVYYLPIGSRERLRATLERFVANNGWTLEEREIGGRTLLSAQDGAFGAIEHQGYLVAAYAEDGEPMTPFFEKLVAGQAGTVAQADWFASMAPLRDGPWHFLALANPGAETPLATSTFSLDPWARGSELAGLGLRLEVTSGPGPQIGTNLGFLQSIEGEWPFVDVFKTSSGWYASGPCGFDCGTLDLDADGWVRSLEPGQHAHAFVFSMVPGQMPHGPGDLDTYTVLYDGVGVIDYSGSVTEVVASSPGRDVVRVDPMSEESFAVSILKTAEDYIRNIRVVAPGGVCTDDPFKACQSDAQCGGTCELFETNYETQIFHPRFLRNIRNYHVLRLMDWMSTNQGLFTSYDEYPTERSARWNQAPATIMAELANRLGTDIWVNVPHDADQSFLDGLATDLATHLDESIKVYVEFSNEVWNPDFDAFLDVTLAGCAADPDLDCDADRNPGNGVLCEGYDRIAEACGTANFVYEYLCLPETAPDCDTARIHHTVDRSIAAWQAFEAAFDADSPGSSASRLVRVLASRTADTALHDRLLSHREVYRQVDAFATLGYFGWGLGGHPIVRRWDADDPKHMAALFRRLGAELEDAFGDIEADRRFLLSGGSHDYSAIPLVAYEGGQGLVAWGRNAETPEALEHANELFDAANRDRRMGALYQRLLDGWRERGGTLFNHYVNCRAPRPWARYGALEHQRQNPASSPKYRKLMQYIRRLP